MTIDELKKELEHLEELEKFTEEAQTESDFDVIYKSEHDCFMKISRAIVQLTNGTVDMLNAKTIVRCRRDRLKEIFGIS